MYVGACDHSPGEMEDEWRTKRAGDPSGDTVLITHGTMKAVGKTGLPHDFPDPALASVHWSPIERNRQCSGGSSGQSGAGRE